MVVKIFKSFASPRKKYIRNYVIISLIMDVYDLIFYEIFKIDPASPVLNGDFFHDLLFGILIPSIFLILFFEEFTKRVFHGKLKHLISIAGLGVIIAYGWYGMLVSVTSFLFPLLLGLYLLFFFYRVIVREKGSEAMIKGAEFVGRKGFEKMLKYIAWNDETKQEISSNLRALVNAYVREKELREDFARATSDVDKRLIHNDIVEILNTINEIEGYLESVIKKFGDKARKYMKDELEKMYRDAESEEKQALKEIWIKLRLPNKSS